MPNPPLTQAARTDSQINPSEQWLLLHRRLNRLGLEPMAPNEFQRQLALIDNAIARALHQDPDVSLFVLIQMLRDLYHGYSATHALVAASLIHLIAPLAELSADQLTSLSQAALTMNIGMRELQDRLAQQIQAPTSEQRDAIARHPLTGVALLQGLEVNDPLWLKLVEEHHETPDGQGYPKGKPVKDPLQHLLRMTDLYIARISPRRSRRALAPNVAIRDLFLEMRTYAPGLSALFAKQLGLYPPGSFVRLQDGETGVVIRRGELVNHPLVIAVADPAGNPLSPPQVRDTQQPGLGIKRHVDPEEVRVRVDLGRLLALRATR